MPGPRRHQRRLTIRSAGCRC